MTVLDKIDEIIALCYNRKNEEALNEIQVLIDEIDTFIMLNKCNKELMYKIILKIYTAIEKKDYVLLGDYLEYGIKPIMCNGDIQDYVFADGVDILPEVQDRLFYIETFSNELCLCVKKKDGVATVRMSSIFSPEHEVNIVYENTKINNSTTTVCLFGLGTGLLAEKILSEITKDFRLVIYEPNREILKYCLQCGEREESDPFEVKISRRIRRIVSDKRVILYVADECTETFNNLLTEYIDYRGLLGLKSCFSTGYSALYPEECLNFLRNIEDFKRTMLNNRGTLQFFKDHYIEYIFRNLGVCKKVNAFGEIKKILPANIPVIIVSSGPSLDKNINELKKAKGHLLIIAVDTALRSLLAKGIVPDLTISVDPIKPLEYFTKFDQALDIPCIFDIDSNHDIIKMHRGRKFLTITNDYILKLFNSVGKNLVREQIGGGSVALAAFVKMLDLGQTKIILVGQDLASSDGKTHAGGVDDGAGTGDIMVEGVNGGYVATRSDWYHYLKWYEKAIETLKLNNINTRVIDATEGGAKIHGSEIMTLQEAILECKDKYGNLPIYDFNNEIDKLEYLLNEKEYSHFCEMHRKNVLELYDIESNANKIVETCNRLIEEIHNRKIQTEKIDKEKKKILIFHEKYKKHSMHSLINLYITGLVVDDISSLSIIDENSKENELRELMLLKISFEAIASAAKKILINAKKYEHLLE